MNVSSIARITRSLHAAVVALHCRSLSLVVKEAKKDADKAYANSRLARAIRDEAEDAYAEAVENCAHMQNAHFVVRNAASMEAQRIGGSI